MKALILPYPYDTRLQAASAGVYTRYIRDR